MQESQPTQRVTVENVNMPLGAMIGLVIKFWIASALAGPIVCVLTGISIMIFQSIFSVSIGTK
jgi:VIT1/CCC1 family predicted Fe2+/Mn2+ transporter